MKRKNLSSSSSANFEKQSPERYKTTRKPPRPEDCVFWSRSQTASRPRQYNLFHVWKEGLRKRRRKNRGAKKRPYTYTTALSLISANLRLSFSVSLEGKVQIGKGIKNKMPEQVQRPPTYFYDPRQSSLSNY